MFSTNEPFQVVASFSPSTKGNTLQFQEQPVEPLEIVPFPRDKAPWNHEVFTLIPRECLLLQRPNKPSSSKNNQWNHSKLFPSPEIRHRGTTKCLPLSPDGRPRHWFSKRLLKAIVLSATEGATKANVPWLFLKWSSEYSAPV